MERDYWIKTKQMYAYIGKRRNTGELRAQNITALARLKENKMKGETYY
jgi:hypothetical protein